MDGFDAQALQGRNHRKHFSRIGWALVVLSLLPLGLQAVLFFVLGRLGVNLGADMMVALTFSTITVYLLGYPAAWYILRRAPELEPLERGGYPFGGGVGSLLVLLAGSFLARMLTVGLTAAIGALRGQSVGDVTEVFGEYPTAYLVLVVCILGPVMEELFFRGVLLEQLRPYGEKFALLASAVIFALFHGNLSQIPYAFVAGLVLGYAALCAGGARWSIPLHMATNALSVAGILVSRYLGASQAALAAESIRSLAVLLATLVGLVLFLRALRREELWLSPGGEELSEGRKWGLLFSNPGMVAYTLTALALVQAFLFLT